MSSRSLLIAITLSSPVLFQFCNEPTVEPLPIAEQPPVVKYSDVNLAIGNTYHWRCVQVPNGGQLPSQWDVRSEIIRDTTIDGDRYFIFSTGEVLRSTSNTVFASSQSSSTEYYRLNVSVGEIVPFMGHQFTVTSVDTGSILGETQKIVTVAATPGDANALHSGRYASKFGLVEINLGDPTSATWGVLAGARIGSGQYGYNP